MEKQRRQTPDKAVEEKASTEVGHKEHHRHGGLPGPHAPPEKREWMINLIAVLIILGTLMAAARLIFGSVRAFPRRVNRKVRDSQREDLY